ncbi:hypothetical protein D2924_02645 [Vibrio cholerae]|nr:hypothetical protein D2924_02645 [Vibrio cholerae]TLE36946.1 hypothetical protein D2925_02720 [Vibrio cholerae]
MQSGFSVVRICYPSHIFFLFEAARAMFAHANHIVCRCLLEFTHLRLSAISGSATSNRLERT